jgi:CPA2 family monovalent cation:H+ antiporter-2
LIREIQLRTETGASIVALERNGLTMINPGPDVEIAAGDQLLLLGDGLQLTSAIRLLSRPKTAENAPP